MDGESGMLIDGAAVSRTALTGKVAVVTGAGQGIGRETTRALARLGAVVILAEISPTGRETEQAAHAEGGRALFVQTDISDPASVKALQGTGLKLEDWLASAENMGSRLEQTASDGFSGETLPSRRELAGYVAQLERLASYIDRQQGDARVWIKDARKLEVALAALRGRAETVRAAAVALSALSEGAP
jgi:hypothetical protein